MLRVPSMLGDIAGVEGPIYFLPSLLHPRASSVLSRTQKLQPLSQGLLFKTGCTTVLSKSALPLFKRFLAMRID